MRIYAVNHSGIRPFRMFAIKREGVMGECDQKNRIRKPYVEWGPRLILEN